MIKPTSVTPPLDAAHWPLLLKVCAGPIVWEGIKL